MMKLNNILNGIILNEIGDTRDGYDFRVIDKKISRQGGELPRTSYLYEFKTEGFTYNIAFYIPPKSTTAQIDFDTLERGEKVTNEGNQFKVVATLINAVSDFGRKMKEIKRPITGFQFMAIPKEDNADLDDITQREKLYIAFIKRRFPRAKITRRSGTVFIDL